MRKRKRKRANKMNLTKQVENSVGYVENETLPLLLFKWWKCFHTYLLVPPFFLIICELVTVDVVPITACHSLDIDTINRSHSPFNSLLLIHCLFCS